MLKTKSLLNENNYVILKLSTGEEVFGKITEVTDTSLKIAAASMLSMVNDTDARMVPYMPFVKKNDANELTFMLSQIISFGEMHDNLKDDYIKMNGGISITPRVN